MKPDSSKSLERNSLTKALQSLPLIRDDPYLHMQAMELGVVDAIIEPMESNLLREYLETEGTPDPNTLIVSALSKLWVFGVYEFLRTWRQRVRKVLQFVDQINSLKENDRDSRIEDQKRKLQRVSAVPESVQFHWKAFEAAAKNPGLAKKLQDSFDGSERPFKIVEAFRIHLAKHEIPKNSGSFGMNPGYGRISMETGSIYWQMVLVGNQVDCISRQEIAQLCRELSLDKPVAILPPKIQEKLKAFSEITYGVKRVILTLDSDIEYEAYVAWNKEIVRIEGFDIIPFDPEKVISAREVPLK